MDPKIQWLRGLVTDDKNHCVYITPEGAVILEHAWQSGFPADRKSLVRSVIDVTTAD